MFQVLKKTLEKCLKKLLVFPQIFGRDSLGKKTDRFGIIIFIFWLILFMFFVYAPHGHCAHRGQKRAADSLKSTLQVDVRHPTRGPGNRGLVFRKIIQGSLTSWAIPHLVTNDGCHHGRQITPEKKLEETTKWSSALQGLENISTPWDSGSCEFIFFSLRELWTTE